MFIIMENTNLYEQWTSYSIAPAHIQQCQSSNVQIIECTNVPIIECTNAYNALMNELQHEVNYVCFLLSCSLPPPTH